ncbi:TIGR03089 family protein [Corynebacterium choanae]|uniref:TIGR03089 family protein n=1 Tax=Corynebacterium choanae TaxID=1862358 RepID=A0A3G6J4N2_9CORY|nr:TIGR03089 family protein [Corynebacterium choanae]AZA12899.1 hypothetical protein CCHOA_02410 [Corynebacterium choanae]
MQLLDDLLHTDPAIPRLTVYNDSADTRVEFSAITLDNWTAKVANMLREEFDLTPGDGIVIDLPSGWQPVVIALGALAAGVTLHFPGDEEVNTTPVVFTNLARATNYADITIDDAPPEIVIVTDDPLGRGVEETGGELPEDFLDFGPAIRPYGDSFTAASQRLSDLVSSDLPTGIRLISAGFTDLASLNSAVLEPLSVGGSAVLVTPPVSIARMETIASKERAVLRGTGDAPSKTP